MCGTGRRGQHLVGEVHQNDCERTKGEGGLSKQAVPQRAKRGKYTLGFGQAVYAGGLLPGFQAGSCARG